MHDKITVIIPAYNEESTIGRVLSEIQLVLPGSRIIVVNDGSGDETAKRATQKGVEVVTHEINKGYGASLKTGIRMVKTEYTLICDADGQHGPEQIKPLLDIYSKYDMTVGARDAKTISKLNRKPGKWVLSKFVNYLTRFKVPDFNSGLRIFKTEKIKRHLNLMPSGFSFSTTSTVAFFRMNYSIKYVQVTGASRENFGSTVNIVKDGIKTLMLIVNLAALFSPHRVFLPFAFMFILSSGMYFILYSLFIRIHVTPSMVMLFLTGVLIFFMGILTEQVAALRRESQQ